MQIEGEMTRYVQGVVRRMIFNAGGTAGYEAESSDSSQAKQKFHRDGFFLSRQKKWR